MQASVGSWQSLGAELRNCFSIQEMSLISSKKWGPLHLRNEAHFVNEMKLISCTKWSFPYRKETCRRDRHYMQIWLTVSHCSCPPCWQIYSSIIHFKHWDVSLAQSLYSHPDFLAAASFALKLLAWPALSGHVVQQPVKSISNSNLMANWPGLAWLLFILRGRPGRHQFSVKLENLIMLPH